MGRGLCAGPCACVRAQAWANRPARLAGPVLERRAFPVLPGGWRVGVGGVMLSWGRRGGNYQLAERAPDNAGEGQVGVWLKEGRSGRGGREEGRGHLFVGIDLCGVGTGGPPPRPRTGRGGGARWGRWAPRRRRPERPAARAAPPLGARRCPVPLNSTKKGYACS